MGKTVILQQNVRECLENLIQILFENDYFGFEESAQIYDFIEFDIINFPYKIFPEKLKHLGTKYAFYKANENTTWYIFFEINDNRILITYITNNHAPELKYL